MLIHKMELNQTDLEKRAKLVLGIDNNQNIRKAYLKKAKRFHPDMPNGNQKYMQIIIDAYNVLQGKTLKSTLLADENIIFEISGNIPEKTQYQKHIEQFYGYGVI